MAERIINVSFEVTDNWTRGDFQELIKGLLKYPERYNVYIISNDDITAYIQSIGRVLGMDSSHVIVVGFTNDKITAINQYNIDIHLDNILYVTTRVDNETDAYGIFVNELPNKYEVAPSYIVEMERAVDRILNGET